MVRQQIGLATVMVVVGGGGPSPADGQTRRWLPEPELETSMVDHAGNLFGTPSQLVAIPAGGFALVDAYSAIRAFDSQGEPLWTYGRSGQGPDEFGFIVGTNLSPEGHLVMLDRSLGRVTVIDGRAGKSISTHRVPATPPLNGTGYSVLPGQGSVRALVIPESAKDTVLWASMSDEGRLVGIQSMPPELKCAHNLTCEFFSTTAGSRGSVVAFRWSSKLLFLTPDGSVSAAVDGVEDVPFPEVKVYDQDSPFGLMTVTRVDPLAPEVTVDLTADSSRLFVLLASSTEASRRVVDVYSVDDRRYVGSYLFPEAIGELAILSDGRMATLDVELYPTIHLWDLTR